MKPPQSSQGASGLQDEAQTVSPPLRTWKFNWALIRYRHRPFALHTLLVLFLFGATVLPGLVEKWVFDTITGNAAASISIWALVALYVSIELARLVARLGVEWTGWTFRLVVQALLRRNVFASILRRPGSQAPAVSSGEAIYRLRNDVDEVSDFPTWLPDVAGQVTTALVAILIMARINLQITLVIFLPLLGTFLISRLAWGRIVHYHRLSGLASDAVTGFLGEMLAAVQAVKIANAEDSTVGHFARLNEARRQAELKVQVFHGMLDSLFGGATSFGIGIMLLLCGQAMAAGRFTIGDFALFVYYLSFTTELPSYLGTFFGDYKTQEVSIERLSELVRPEPNQVLVEHHSVYEYGDYPPLVRPERNQADRLDILEIDELSYQHAQNSHGIKDIRLTIRRGSFTVITGRIGSGKSTFLRVLLGLLPRDSGEVRWNGVRVQDPAAFMIPPRCAYTSQVPRLFSETVQDNILLGLNESPAALQEALRLAVVEKDIAGMPYMLDTLVGPRGIRLSGGQVQRVAAARMFVRQPEIFVFDDLSSALDVETERALWDGLVQRGRHTPTTCLVVSHRRAALQLADHIMVLKNGSVEAEGTLAELLETSQEMQRLWQGDLRGENSTEVKSE